MKYLAFPPAALFIAGLIAVMSLVQAILGLIPWSWLGLVPLYVLAGHVMCVFSVVFVTRSFARSVPLGHGYLRRIAPYGREVLRKARIVFTEELLFRVLPVWLVRSWDLPPACLLAVAALFTVLHVFGHDEVFLWELLELFLFACVLTFAYYVWLDLSLVIALHLCRNVNSLLMKHPGRGAAARSSYVEQRSHIGNSTLPRNSSSEVHHDDKPSLVK